MSEDANTILFQTDILKLEAIKDYITANLEKELNLTTLSDNFNMGKSTLRRQFKHHFQKSVSCFILDCRMERAMRLLINHAIPISQIASEVGYNNRAGFTRAFSKHFGYAPSYFLRAQKVTGND